MTSNADDIDHDWPRRPDGTRKTVGEMTLEEQHYVFRRAGEIAASQAIAEIVMAERLRAFSDWGLWGQAVPLCRAASSHFRGSLASLRGRRGAAAGWGQEGGASQSVSRPLGRYRPSAQMG